MQYVIYIILFTVGTFFGFCLSAILGVNDKTHDAEDTEMLMARLDKAERQLEACERILTHDPDDEEEPR